MQAMRGPFGRRLAVSASAAFLAGVLLALPATAAEIELQPDTSGCGGIVPPNEGNTDMRVVGGTLWPGGTAVFEISYPVNPAHIGKEFTILDCAFINDVAALKYIISFVPSNEFFILRITLAVPNDAPVGGLYCNYAKTTGAPTAPQASQRKAGPTCFIIRPRPTSSQPQDPDDPATTSGPILLPNTAMAPPASR